MAGGLVIASLGGGELALREHLAGYRSHSSLLAGVATFVAVTAVALGARTGEAVARCWWWASACSAGPSTGCASCFAAARAGSASGERSIRCPRRMEERRLRIRGLHHVTLICRDVERAVDFYRNLLGMRLVKQSVNSDDPSARHLFFGDDRGAARLDRHLPRVPGPRRGPGRPRLHPSLRPRGGHRGGARAWHDYLTGRGVPCTAVMDRVYFKSLYMRDPDGHIVELATEGPGLTGGRAPEAIG